MLVSDFFSTSGVSIQSCAGKSGGGSKVILLYILVFHFKQSIKIYSTFLVFFLSHIIAIHDNQTYKNILRIE